jgi:hypothetical protein
MRFVVPQFIEVEDKIIGPISVRQFVIFLIAFGIIFIEYKIFGFVLFIFIALFTFGFAGIVAFAKINGQAFHYFILNIVYTIRKPKIKIWNKVVIQEKGTPTNKGPMKTSVVVPPKMVMTNSKLTRLSLVVDTGGAFKEEDEDSAF